MRKNLKKRMTPEQRFLAYLPDIRDEKCWIWRGPIRTNGYGDITISPKPYTTKSIAAHRFSYEYFKEDIPTNKIICHHCDTPLCVNPDHLFIGTIQENMDDRNNKKRQARNEKHGRAKLTEELVKKIRREYQEGGTKLGLSKKYKVGRTTIRAVISRKTWKDV